MHLKRKPCIKFHFKTILLLIYFVILSAQPQKRSEYRTTKSDKYKNTDTTCKWYSATGPSVNHRTLRTVKQDKIVIRGIRNPTITQTVVWCARKDGRDSRLQWNIPLELAKPPLFHAVKYRPWVYWFHRICHTKQTDMPQMYNVV